MTILDPQVLNDNLIGGDFDPIKKDLASLLAVMIPSSR